jgi:hypothetical protein
MTRYQALLEGGSKRAIFIDSTSNTISANAPTHPMFRFKSARKKRNPTICVRDDLAITTSIVGSNQEV